MSETVVHNQHGCEIKMSDDNSRTAEQSNKASSIGEKGKFLTFWLAGGGAGAEIYLIYKGCYSGEEKRGVRKCMGGMVQGN